MTSSSASVEAHGKPPSAIRDVYIIVRRDNEILLLLRSSTGYKDGEWGPPSGKVEDGETYAVAAVRELFEETGIMVDTHALRFVHVMERTFEGSPPWLGMFFEVTTSDEPRNLEPEKHAAMEWFELDKVPVNTVDYVLFAIRATSEGNRYSEWDA